MSSPNPFGGPIRITIGINNKVFVKYQIDLLRLFEPNSGVPEKLNNALHMNDAELIKIFSDLYPLISGKPVSEELIDSFGAEERDAIRSTIWDAIENFTSSHLRHLAKELRFQITTALAETTLGDSSSVSQPEPELNAGTTP